MTQFNDDYPTGSAAYFDLIQHQVKTALEEDIGPGDLTALLIPAQQLVQASIIARESAVLCGKDWVNTCFQQLDKAISIKWLAAEGERIHPNQTLCMLHGSARALLSGERCALNFLQTLSSTATETRKYVDAVAGTQAKILDTRKTIPHLRLAQKYAVGVGGGENQRLALYDGILIKENHIASAGGIPEVLQQAFALSSPKNIQIEVESLQQLQIALDAGATNILLDNFDKPGLREAVKINQAHGKQALLEASGGISLANVREIAETGVDRISIGALTKNIQAIDLSMRFSD